jgi:hypothetical protein
VQFASSSDCGQKAYQAGQVYQQSGGYRAVPLQQTRCDYNYRRNPSRLLSTSVSVTFYNSTVLSFLGMINTARFDNIKVSTLSPLHVAVAMVATPLVTLNMLQSQGTSRNTIHISKIRSEARWGDLILFKCTNTLSHLQRQVTRSEWDHVGIVVRSLGNNGVLSTHSGALDLLEATGEGVTCYPLTGRLKAYQYNNVSQCCYI